MSVITEDEKLETYSTIFFFSVPQEYTRAGVRI